MRAWFDRSNGKFKELLAQSEVFQSIPEARNFQVFMSNELSVLVVDGKVQFIVHLNKKFCECLDFQHNGIPCIHAIPLHADGTVMPPKTKKHRRRPNKKRIRSKGEDLSGI
jgi:hypothetical protein